MVFATYTIPVSKKFMKDNIEVMTASTIGNINSVNIFIKASKKGAATALKTCPPVSISANKPTPNHAKNPNASVGCAEKKNPPNTTKTIAVRKYFEYLMDSEILRILCDICRFFVIKNLRSFL
ncbi:MAG: hypothetical protein A3F94_02830 [Candidatus Spechtbacteria bacterium RIFCSPLOWO2_12_FULL_38_22]|uniref:Uncharacterized protein n=1 Tax=Candidatus Spechtbacteria bacterium RIFCSPLOWO2_12_FULL_38_22 TaxID=1802165 RepID=A0A1G2HID2_9BACT|nr:MAG: hypothetical protein A2728_01515 [Candidatus Spechtbacteria bacterium RIFCSPHIGHO2_01_FULL_38_11]OGZ60062.1 MAG: hypothetical protein A3E58_01830 [Candidatus Spechtbacteria bacterium RIFCSPHIGHO2_12_FULL_38_30]OGZ60938.1 MAG: hypothetical protein A3A00_02300 [Candidatus Spechtbacteria bacterium RIFCSPLOWO2_01_FULL_38_20]OGZ62237.1 MAG: hypothetical protein A3F94_02830 [Candidatus Spechtbacteria bacterium RIFCSPLOWO2_12_FULL_38_22]